MFAQDIANHSEALCSEIKGKEVLVIGGAGTIGSSYIKAILPFRPASLTVVDYSENGLTELTRDLRSAADMYIPEKYITYPFDFGSKPFAKLMSDHHFDIIACFAAHKHVRSEKDALAIEAMINNNVFNTHKLLELALKNKPDHFFSVSTDKASNPVNVMGASKKLMEKVLMAYTPDMKISTARFANVAFSNGSLPDGFINRIMKRQPLSAPADVRRYFVSPEESGQLCLLASILGESGDIIFPKLKEEQMMKFSTIAKEFLKAMGYECDYCASEEEARRKAARWTPELPTYPVYFFGSDTSGEKMYEEFFEDGDIVDSNRFAALGVIKNSESPDKAEVLGILDDFKQAFASGESKAEVVELIGKHLSGFSHIETGKNLDSKM